MNPPGRIRLQVARKEAQDERERVAEVRRQREIAKQKRWASLPSRPCCWVLALFLVKCGSIPCRMIGVAVVFVPRTCSSEKFNVRRLATFINDAPTPHLRCSL